MGEKVSYIYTKGSKKDGGEFKQKITHIVIHNTFNNASAQNEAIYSKRTENDFLAGFHFVCDENECIQCQEVTRIAWHSGSSHNMHTIGIEIAKSLSTDSDLKNIIIRNSYVHVYNIFKWIRLQPSSDILLMHKDCSGKNCPHDIINRFGWERYKLEFDKYVLEKELAEGTNKLKNILNKLSSLKAA